MSKTGGNKDLGIYNKIWMKILVVVVWIMLWQLIAAAVNNTMLIAGPVQVILKFGEKEFLNVFVKALFCSYLRIMAGLLLSFLIAYFLAFAAFDFPFVKLLLNPFVCAVKSVPVAAVTVMFLIWFGADNLSLYITFMVVFPPVYIGMLTGFESAPEDMLEMAKAYGISKRNCYRFIYRQSYLPQLKSSLKVCIGMCFKSGIAAELIGLPKNSIGTGIYQNKIVFDTAGILAYTIAVIAVSYCTEIIILKLLDGFRYEISRGTLQNVIGNEKTASEKSVDDDARIHSVEHLIVGYENENVKCRIVTDFSYDFSEGGIYAVTGESGSGKSSLMKCIGRNLKCDVSFLFQENRLIMDLSAINNLLIVPSAYSEEELRDMICNLIDETAVNKKTSELSGGMQRRLAIIRCMIMKSQVYILDEPFAGLDVENRERTMDFILKMQQNMTLIIATHDVSDVPCNNVTEIRMEELERKNGNKNG